MCQGCEFAGVFVSFCNSFETVGDAIEQNKCGDAHIKINIGKHWVSSMERSAGLSTRPGYDPGGTAYRRNGVAEMPSLQREALLAEKIVKAVPVAALGTFAQL